jgi:hypothetical protein
MIDAGDPRLVRLCLGKLTPEEVEQLQRQAFETPLGLGLVDLFRTLPGFPDVELRRERDERRQNRDTRHKRAALIEDRARYWDSVGDDAWPSQVSVTERAQGLAERCWYRAGALRRAARYVAEGRVPETEDAAT